MFAYLQFNYLHHLFIFLQRIYKIFVVPPFDELLSVLRSFFLFLLKCIIHTLTCTESSHLFSTTMQHFGYSNFIHQLLQGVRIYRSSCE